jgi:hypothetical protein
MGVRIEISHLVALVPESSRHCEHPCATHVAVSMVVVQRLGMRNDGSHDAESEIGDIFGRDIDPECFQACLMETS